MKALAVICAILAILLGLQTVRLADEQKARAQDRSEADKRQADAVSAELKRGNETAELLRANHAKAEERAVIAERQEAAASAAADAAGRMARRVRDASETSLLAARAAIESTGASKQCAPAIEAADMRELMFRRIDTAADEIGGAALGISRHADKAFNASVECAAAYKTVTR